MNTYQAFPDIYGGWMGQFKQALVELSFMCCVNFAALVSSDGAIILSSPQYLYYFQF